MPEKKTRYRLDEAAARFGVSPRTFRRWWLSGETCLVAWRPSHKLGSTSKGLFFTAESIEEFDRSGFVSPEIYEDLLLEESLRRDLSGNEKNPAGIANFD